MFRSLAKKVELEHILLVVIGILFIIFLLKFFQVSQKKTIKVCIYSDHQLPGQVNIDTTKLQEYIQNLQSAKYIVISGRNPNEELNKEKLMKEFGRCDLIITVNLYAAKQFVLDALNDYVNGGGKLIVIGDSLSMRLIDYDTKPTPVTYLFGMRWDRDDQGRPKVLKSKDIRVYDPEHPLFINCVAENGKLALSNDVTFVVVRDEDIDTLAAFTGTSEGSKPAILMKNQGQGTVIVFTYDPSATPCILQNTIEYLTLGQQRNTILGIQIPTQIF